VTADQTVQLIGALAWPLVVLIAVVLLRKPLAGLLAGIPGRATKVSLAWFSLELAQVPEVKPMWTVDYGSGSADVREAAGSNIFDSYADTLLQSIEGPGSLDFAVVDLGRGDKWLSSRLFLFAVLLRRMRGLRRLVFVQTNDLSDRVFVGSADPEVVRWALAQRYPWLEVAFAAAYQGTFSLDPRLFVEPVIMSEQGALGRREAGSFARKFLDALQQPATMPEPSKPEEWVRLEPKLPNEQPFRERAEWMTTDQVREILQGVRDSRNTVEIDQAWSNEERVKAVLRAQGDFVVMLDGPRFDSLLDRRQLLDGTIRRVLAES
jgi:hypothetical protein